VLGLTVAAGCVFLLRRLDLALVLEAAGSARPMSLFGALLLSVVFIQARGLRWWLLVRIAGEPCRLRDALGISSLGLFAAGLGPGLGEAARLILLRRRALPLARATTIVLQDRLVDTVLSGLFLCVGLARHTGLSGVVTSVSPIGLIALGGGVAVGLLLLGRPGRSERAVVFVRAVLEAWGPLRHSPALLSGIVLGSAGIQLLAVAAAWLTLSALAIVAPIELPLLLVALTNLGLGLAPSPLGLGLYQAVGLAVLGGIVASPELAVAAATLFQAVSYAALVLAALPAALGGLIGGRVRRPMPA
jgi:uncharacterized membrane protein YbhN (UPF0104 family)